MEKTEASYRDPDFFTQQFQEELRSHLQENLKEPFQPHYRQFYPIMLAKIETVFASWLNTLRLKAETGATQTELSAYMDNKSFQLIQSHFSRTLRIIELYKSSIPQGSFQNEKKPIDTQLINGIFQDGEMRHVSFQSIWAQNNPYLYKTNQAQRGHQEADKADSNSLAHYQDALEGKETDLVLKSIDSDEPITMHQLYLMSASHPFRAQLEKEPQKRIAEITLPYRETTLSAMRQFVYLGEITDFGSRFEDKHYFCELLNLLALSHDFKMNDLYEYVIVLMNDLIKKKPLETCDIESLVFFATKYEATSLLEISIQAMEDLESCEIKNLIEQVDPKKHVDILMIASDLSLEKVKQVITENIQEKIQHN